MAREDTDALIRIQQTVDNLDDSIAATLAEVAEKREVCSSHPRYRSVSSVLVYVVGRGCLFNAEKRLALWLMASAAIVDCAFLHD